MSQTMPEMWSKDAPPESAMLVMLEEDSGKTRELHNEMLPRVQEKVYEAQGAETKVLFTFVCKEWKSNAEEKQTKSAMPDLQKGVRQIQSTDQEKSGALPFLQPDVLVSIQSKEKSLLVDGRTTRANEPARHSVEKSGDEEGCKAVSDMLLSQTLGGTPYTTFRKIQETQMGREQRNYSLSRVSCEVPESRNAVCGSAFIHSVSSSSCSTLNTTLFGRVEVREV